LRFFRFPNKALTRITDDYVFKQVRVAHGFLCLLLKKRTKSKRDMEGTQGARARVSREGKTNTDTHTNEKKKERKKEKG
jgi:hypothetical protein